jgi:RecA-family ATPase
MAGAQPIPFKPHGDPKDGSKQRQPAPLIGASLFALSQKEVKGEQTLLGKRWLCVAGGAIIVGPSGVGKSTPAVQAAALWSCGRAAFGIKPARPLRVLIIQAEDDEGDSIEMSRMVDHLKLNELELQQIDQNTHLEFLNDKTAHRFTQRLDEILSLWPCELVIINPLTAYLGDDTKDEKSVNQFLRT